MPLDPLDYHDNIGDVVTLMAWTMRGHHPASNPLTLTPDVLEREVLLRSGPHPERRWITPPLREIISEVIGRVCKKHGYGCLDIVVGKTCVYASVRFGGYQCKEDSMHDAVRLVTARRARTEIAWSRAERVFAPQRLWWPIGIEEACVDFRARMSELERL